MTRSNGPSTPISAASTARNSIATPASAALATAIGDAGRIDVVADDLGVGERRRQGDGRPPGSAAEIRHPAPGLQPIGHPGSLRHPGGQVVVEGGPVDAALAVSERPSVVGVRDPTAGPVGVDHPIDHLPAARHHVGQRGDVVRVDRLGQYRLLGVVQEEAAHRRRWRPIRRRPAAPTTRARTWGGSRRPRPPRQWSVATAAARRARAGAPRRWTGARGRRSPPRSAGHQARPHRPWRLPHSAAAGPGSAVDGGGALSRFWNISPMAPIDPRMPDTSAGRKILVARPSAIRVRASR